MGTRFKFIVLAGAAVGLSGCQALPPMPSGDGDPTLDQVRVAQTPPSSADPSADLMFRLLVAEIAGQRGDLELALDSYLEVARRTGDMAIAQRALQIAMFAGADQAALEAATIWEAGAPGNREAQQVIAMLLVRTGQAEAAVAQLERMLGSGEDLQQAFMAAAALLGREQDAHLALSVMERLVASQDQRPEGLYAYAHLAMVVGQLDLAAEITRQLSEVRPGWANAAILRAGILKRQGEAERALAVVAEAARKNPDNQELRLYYARMLIEENELEEARSQFGVVLELAPDNADALFALGLLGLQSGNIEEAEGRFLALVRSGRHRSDAAYFLGQIAEARGNPGGAQRWYDMVVSGQYFVDAQIRAALALAADGQLGRAQERLQAIDVQQSDELIRLYLAQGELLRQAKQYDDAFDFYSRALSEFPDHSDLLYARALVAERLDQLDVLEEDLRAILETEPDNAQALNALGYTLADRTDRYQEAFELVSRAYELRPDDGAILDSMGWVHYRLGNYADAERYLRKALEKAEDPEIAAHLGEVLWMAGERDEARAIWERALQQAPDHEVLRETVQRLLR